MFKYLLFTILAIKLLLVMNSCKTSSDINNDVYQKAVNLIVNNGEEGQFKRETVFISDETIPFHLATVYSGVVRNSYIVDYDEMKDYNENDLKRINQIIDSLSQKSKTYNLDFNKNLKNIINPTHNRLNKKIKYVAFFSMKKENFLYCELRKFDINMNSNRPTSQELSYGTSYNYLFKINDNNDIVLVADGKSHLN